MSHKLESVLARKQREFEEESGLYTGDRNVWIERVTALYDEIEDWLGPLKRKGYLQTSRQFLKRTEEPYGTYSIPSLLIVFFNGRQITLDPKGLNVVGAKGRLDVELEGKSIPLVISAKTGRWEVPERLGATFETTVFSREMFEELIEEFVDAF